MHTASVKMIQGVVIPTCMEPWWERMVTLNEGGVLEQTECSFQVDNFLSVIRISGVRASAFPKLIEEFRTYGEWEGFRNSGGPHLGVPLYCGKGSATQGVRI